MHRGELMEQTRVTIFSTLEMHSRRVMLEGFHSVALARGWMVFRSLAKGNMEGFFNGCDPAAVVVCPESGKEIPRVFRTRVLLSLYADRTAEGIASFTEDNTVIGRAAAEHLLVTGLRRFACFSYTLEPWARERMDGFREAAMAGGGTYDSGGEMCSDPADPRFASMERVHGWLRSLAKPCGIFTCCDTWARGLALDCMRLGIRIPEEIAVVGSENDHLQCELFSPPISSVDTPWYEMGRRAAEMVDAGLKTGSLPATLTKIPPIGVVVRRSSDVVAVDDPDVHQAVAWIRSHGHQPLAVTDVLRAVPVYRRRLERRFRAVLGRSILDEIRRAHIEVAKRLLAKTDLTVIEVAERSGYSNATLLAVAFRRETGMTPGQYRRKSQIPHGKPADDR